jgi:hypothetical protein
MGLTHLGVPVLLSTVVAGVVEVGCMMVGLHQSTETQRAQAQKNEETRHMIRTWYQNYYGEPLKTGATSIWSVLEDLVHQFHTEGLNTSETVSLLRAYMEAEAEVEGWLEPATRHPWHYRELEDLLPLVQQGSVHAQERFTQVLAEQPELAAYFPRPQQEAPATLTLGQDIW